MKVVAKTSSEVRSRHVALLRGINVGGKNMLPMRELVGIFVEAGCGDVQTYIQSGNVVFSAGKGVLKGLPGLIAERIEGRFGFRVPVLVRSAEQMDVMIRSNPFLLAGVTEDLLHVYFLAGLPTAGGVAKLDRERSAPDRFQVVGQEVYLHLPNGMARTKLSNAYFDAKLATICTARNWRTVLTLYKLMVG